MVCQAVGAALPAETSILRQRAPNHGAKGCASPLAQFYQQVYPPEISLRYITVTVCHNGADGQDGPAVTVRRLAERFGQGGPPRHARLAAIPLTYRPCV